MSGGCCTSSSDTEEVAIELMDGQESIYSVPEEFHVANLDAARIAAIIQSRKRKKRKADWWKNQWDRVKELFTFSLVARRLLGIPLIFLFFYYLVQINYQFDYHYLMCPAKSVTARVANRQSSGSSTGSGSNMTHTKTCREWAKAVLKDTAANYGTITKLITFLLGFYVSNIINRWWNKVRSVPKVENPSMVLSALTWENSNAKVEELTSPAAVAEAKKMVARYCLLSWTMCFNTFSKPLAEKCGTAKDLEQRGLITKDEIAALQVPKGGEADCKFLSDLWWVPITWATNLISRMGVNAPKPQMIVPKDHKDVISAMQKYKKDLENQKTCGDNRLPSFYQKVIHRAIYGWIVFSVVCCQQTAHHKEQDSHWAPVLISNFPATAILVQMVLLGWLYMADILENPFGYNEQFDINLDEELELNIWRCSVTIQHQSVAKSGTEKERENLQKKIWQLIRPATAI